MVIYTRTTITVLTGPSRWTVTPITSGSVRTRWVMLTGVVQTLVHICRRDIVHLMSFIWILMPPGSVWLIKNRSSYLWITIDFSFDFSNQSPLFYLNHFLKLADYFYYYKLSRPTCLTKLSRPPSETGTDKGPDKILTNTAILTRTGDTLVHICKKKLTWSINTGTF